MQTGKPFPIPVVSSQSQQEALGGSACSGKETVALMALGDSMAPEFIEGEILVIEMGRPAVSGNYVIAEVAPDDFTFRQLKCDADGKWRLVALNPAYPDTMLPGLDQIRGVVVAKRNARSRKSVKRYDG